MNDSAMAPGKGAIALRILGALFGGYAFTSGAVACSTLLLIAAGVARSESVTIATLLGFPLYLVVLLWSFCTPALHRVWLALAGGGAALVWASRLARDLL
jgi:hypothetical protein